MGRGGARVFGLGQPGLTWAGRGWLAEGTLGRLRPRLPEASAPPAPPPTRPRLPPAVPRRRAERLPPLRAPLPLRRPRHRAGPQPRPARRAADAGARRGAAGGSVLSPVLRGRGGGWGFGVGWGGDWGGGVGWGGVGWGGVGWGGVGWGWVVAWNPGASRGDVFLLPGGLARRQAAETCGSLSPPCLGPHRSRRQSVRQLLDDFPSAAHTLAEGGHTPGEGTEFVVAEVTDTIPRVRSEQVRAARCSGAWRGAARRGAARRGAARRGAGRLLAPCPPRRLGRPREALCSPWRAWPRTQPTPHAPLPSPPGPAVLPAGAGGAGPHPAGARPRRHHQAAAAERAVQPRVERCARPAARASPVSRRALAMPLAISPATRARLQAQPDAACGLCFIQTPLCPCCTPICRQARRTTRRARCASRRTACSTRCSPWAAAAASSCASASGCLTP
jgi:hypothetical protein